MIGSRKFILSIVIGICTHLVAFLFYQTLRPSAPEICESQSKEHMTSQQFRICQSLWDSEKETLFQKFSKYHLYISYIPEHFKTSVAVFVVMYVAISGALAWELIRKFFGLIGITLSQSLTPQLAGATPCLNYLVLTAPMLQQMTKN